VIERGGGAALELLKRGLVNLAGLHRSSSKHPGRNLETVRERLGGNYRLLRLQMAGGLAIPVRSVPPSTIVRHRRGALCEQGSAAWERDELLGQ
jgi:hypothetical protein